MDMERISALLDDELSAAELDALLAEQGADAGLQAREAAALGRYSAVREALGGGLIAAPVGFADRVLAACAEDVEPERADAGQRVVPIRRPRRSGRLAPAWGLAAAASIAVVAVLSILPQVTDTPADEVVLVSPSSLQAAPPPVRRAQAPSNARVALAPRSRQQVNSYVMEYHNARTGQAFNTLGYARLAAYTGSTSNGAEQR